MTRSILPNSSPQILTKVVHPNGDLQVKLLSDGDHGLYIGILLVAIHNNAFSCFELGQRIIKAWNGERTISHALEQFDYILRCGGLGISRETLKDWIEQPKCNSL